MLGRGLCYVDQTGLELNNPPASASHVLHATNKELKHFFFLWMPGKPTGIWRIFVGASVFLFLLLSYFKCKKGQTSTCSPFICAPPALAPTLCCKALEALTLHLWLHLSWKTDPRHPRDKTCTFLLGPCLGWRRGQNAQGHRWLLIALSRPPTWTILLQVLLAGFSIFSFLFCHC